VTESETDQPLFFETRDALYSWLEEHHTTLPEAWIGMYKKASGQPSVAWPDVVDVVLCFGWIDGKGKSIDEKTHKVRITPRRKGSIWSAVNVKRVQELTEMGLMQPPGLAAFEARKEARTGIYSHEQDGPIELDAAAQTRFQANAQAWEWFQAQPPSYRKAAIWWVISAKKEETRQRRLETLIADSAAEKRVAQLAPRKASR
jgi:uncharacterized protein YdeI (YjbR/CyaY-like superfamily)